MEIQYSTLDQKKEMVVRALQGCIWFSSDVNLANVIEYNILGTCQYNQQDIRMANKIRVPSIAALIEKRKKCQNKMK